MALSPSSSEPAGPERRYSPDHVWIDEDGRVGVTERLTRGLPRITALHLPPVGTGVRAAEPFGALEGDKGLLDLFAPCDGRVLAINHDVVARPDLLEKLPESHWLVVIDGAPAGLLSKRDYSAAPGHWPTPHR